MEGGASIEFAEGILGCLQEYGQRYYRAFHRRPATDATDLHRHLFIAASSDDVVTFPSDEEARTAGHDLPVPDPVVLLSLWEGTQYAQEKFEVRYIEALEEAWMKNLFGD